MLLRICVQGAYLYHTLLTGSHVEFCGGNAQKLFSGQGLNQVHIFNQGMTRQQPIHTQWTLNLIPEVGSLLSIPGAVSAIGWTAGSNVILQDFSGVSALFQDHPVSQPTSASVLRFSFASFLVLGQSDDIKESQAKDHSGPLYPSGVQKLYVARQYENNNKMRNRSKRIRVGIDARSPSTIPRHQHQRYAPVCYKRLE